LNLSRAGRKKHSLLGGPILTKRTDAEHRRGTKSWYLKKNKRARAGKIKGSHITGPWTRYSGGVIGQNSTRGMKVRGHFDFKTKRRRGGRAGMRRKRENAVRRLVQSLAQAEKILSIY